MESRHSASDPFAVEIKLWLRNVMREFVIVFGFVTLGLGSGCATITDEPHAAVFQNPSLFEGKEVEVCGRLGGTSNLISSRNKSHGLSISASEEIATLILYQLRKDNSACLFGVIEHLGCTSDPKTICVDWSFDYAIRVSEVR